MGVNHQSQKFMNLYRHCLHPVIKTVLSLVGLSYSLSHDLLAHLCVVPPQLPHYSLETLSTPFILSLPTVWTEEFRVSLGNIISLGKPVIPATGKMRQLDCCEFLRPVRDIQWDLYSNNRTVTAYDVVKVQHSLLWINSPPQTHEIHETHEHTSCSS